MEIKWLHDGNLEEKKKKQKLELIKHVLGKK